MKKFIFLILFILAGMTVFGRNYTEFQEWKGKKLPKAVKRGVLAEVYDMKEAPGIRGVYPSLQLRIHNRGEAEVEELIVELWLWKRDGLSIKEFVLVGEPGKYRGKMPPGKEEYFPGKYRYYKFKDIQFKDLKNIEIKISKVRVRSPKILK